jgi:hypothetical protein
VTRHKLRKLPLLRLRHSHWVASVEEFSLHGL